MPSCHSQLRCHTRIERPTGRTTCWVRDSRRDRAATDRDPQPHLADQPEVEDAQLKANGLREWALTMMKENAALRRQLGMA